MSETEKKMNCKICFQEKDTTITLDHINPTGDVSEHQMCEDCYKSMTKNECPFCRCEIILPKSKSNAMVETRLPCLLTPDEIRIGLFYLN